MSKYFNQEDVDRIVRQRLERDRASRDAELDELRRKVAELEQPGSQDHEALAEARQAELDSQAAIRDAQLRAAIRTESARLGAIDPDAVAAMLDTSEVTYGDDGPDNMESLVSALLSVKPYLKGGQATPHVSADQGARPSPSYAEDALRLMTENPSMFDALVALGHIPKDVFSH